MKSKNTTNTQLPEFVSIPQYVARRNAANPKGKKLYEARVRRLIADGIIKTHSIAGKVLINWDDDGDLEIDGPVVAVQKAAAKIERSGLKEVADSVNRLADIVKSTWKI